MLVGNIIIDSNGNEQFIPESDTGFYLAKDAAVMVNILDKNLSSIKSTTIGIKNTSDEEENGTDQNT